MHRLTRCVASLVAAALLAACATDDRATVDRAGTSSTTESAAASTGSTTSTTATTVPSTTAATALAADTCPAVPERAEPDPDRPVYEVDMTADPATGVVEGTQAVRFVPDLPIDRVVLRLWANGPRPASVGTSIELGPVAVGGRPAPLEQPDPTTAVVALDRWVPAGEVITVRVAWRLTVGGPVNDRISRQDGSLRLGSFLPLLAWEPGVGWSVDPPTSGFAESTSSPTARWSVSVDVPEGLGVVATGSEVAPGRWEVDAARDVAVSVGRFTVSTATAMAPDPVEVTVAVHDDIDDGAVYVDRIVAALESFASWYGPYPWPAYRLSITPDLSGGIEFPMHVLQGSGTSGRTTPHEVAHMWFYGLVGNVQGRDPWLDEGLATWAEGRIEGTLPDMAGRSVPADGDGRAGAPMAYWEGRAASYYRSVYVQPAAALHRLGDDALVDCALAHYVAANAWSLATPADLWRSLDATFVDWRTALGPAGLAPG
ncbi:hypothetical protein NHL50_15470 [Acidimicrobiia bacterium EGI L10123]|uniref:hypothetical protein n=1 Tax=Salinilacustrithrix flava TaxID=2957203 RepID=UPI003D7C2B1B|nr:hypothetical protein [Acidimicrobiia bacterium EGI L10123]